MTKKALIYVPSENDKITASKCCQEVINVIEKHALENFGLKCYVLQTLLESFEETYNVNIRNGVSIKDKDMC